jgi:L-iditol 2-dehydrogenase
VRFNDECLSKKVCITIDGHMVLSILKAALVNSEGRLELTDLDVPKIGKTEILVKMRTCGVCGTDLAKLQGLRVTPPVLGHEVVGEIEEVGVEVTGCARGDRVAVHHHVPCGNCYYCKHGDQTMCPDFPKSNLDPCGFADYFRVPEINVKRGAVFHIPSSMDYEEAAFAEPTGCCIRALNKLAVRQGDNFLVVGAGPAGLTFIQLLRSLGASLIVASDLIESRLKLATKFGADAGFNPAQENSERLILEETHGRGVDGVVVASGSNKAIQSSLRFARKGGRILLFGVPSEGNVINWDASYIFIREISLIPSYSTTESEMKAALEMMESGKIGLTSMITQRFNLDEIAEAFSAARDSASSLKVMVKG